MRILTFILILLLQGISLFASADGALLSEENYITYASEEISAGWERDSEAKLWDGRVLSDLRNKQEENFSLNAYCSTEGMEKVARIRKLASDIILSSIKSGTTGSELPVAGEILKKSAGVSFTPLTMKERYLVSNTGNVNFLNDKLSGAGVSPGNMPRPEYAVSSLTIIFTVSPVLKHKIFKEKKMEITSFPKSGICGANTSDREFADIYKQFLYVRDNTGNGKSQTVTYNKLTLCSLQTLYNSTRYKNTSKTKIKILTPGASL